MNNSVSRGLIGVVSPMVLVTGMAIFMGRMTGMPLAMVRVVVDLSVIRVKCCVNRIQYKFMVAVVYLRYRVVIRFQGLCS